MNGKGFGTSMEESAFSTQDDFKQGQMSPLNCSVGNPFMPSNSFRTRLGFQRCKERQGRTARLEADQRCCSPQCSVERRVRKNASIKARQASQAYVFPCLAHITADEAK